MQTKNFFAFLISTKETNYNRASIFIKSLVNFITAITFFLDNFIIAKKQS